MALQLPPDLLQALHGMVPTAPPPTTANLPPGLRGMLGSAPLGSAPPPSPQAPTPRFTPWTGAAPSQAPLGATPGPGAQPGAQPAGQPGAQARFTPFTGSTAPRSGNLGGQINVNPSGNPTVDAIRRALGALGGGVGGLNTANQLLGGNAFGGLGGYLPALSGLLGLGAGGLGIANAIQQGNIPGAIASGAGTLGGVAALGGTGALGGAGTALSSAVAPVLGTLALPLAGLGLWASNEDAQRANKIQSALRDTRNIRRDFGVAWPQLEGGGRAYDSMLQAFSAMTPEQQLQALPGIIEGASTGIGAKPAVSQFISTQGGRHGTLPGGPSVSPVDVSGFESESGLLTVKSVLANIAARDKLAQLGAPYDEALRAQDPMSALRDLDSRWFYGPQIGDARPYIEGVEEYQGGYTQADLPNWPTPGEMVTITTPGGRLQGIQALLTRLDPNFSQSRLAPMFAELLPFLGGQVSPSAQATIAQQGVAANKAYQDRLLQEQNQRMLELAGSGNLPQWLGGGGTFG